MGEEGGQGTVRQRIIEAITGTLLSSRRLAGLLGVAERHIEDHLHHIVKSLTRDRTRNLIVDPPACLDCGFVFRTRQRLTKPSRCPKCRSEAVSRPRFGVEVSGRSTPMRPLHPP